MWLQLRLKTPVLCKELGAVMLCFCFTAVAYSQAAYSIKGRVVDENNEIIPAATVVIKGTDNATSTDNNGAFNLTIDTKNAVIIISSIGYEKQEIKWNGNNNITVTLKQKASALE